MPQANFQWGKVKRKNEGDKSDFENARVVDAGWRAISVDLPVV